MSSPDLSRFEPVGLEALGAASLLDRQDSRFLVAGALLAPFLDALAEGYRILEVDGVRAAAYHTRYFDTPALDFYHAHHAGRRPRFKVRIRTYVDSGAGFLEVKLRSNRDRTRKTRVPLAAGDVPVERVRREALLGGVGMLRSATLESALVATFTRVTLVAKDAPERVTIDTGLHLERGGRTLDLSGLAIVEVKQPRHARSSALRALHALGVREGALSKYCLGIASLEASAKRNRFLPALRDVERRLRSGAGRRAA